MQTWVLLCGVATLLVRLFLTLVSSRRCGKRVCEDCSKSRRRLSRQDPNLYRVCVRCEEKLRYGTVERVFQGVENNRDLVAKLYRGRISQIQEKQRSCEKRAAFVGKKVHTSAMISL